MEKENFLRTKKIIQGLTRIENLSVNELYNLIKYDIDHGVNFFDLSDVFNCGENEKKFGKVMEAHPELKDKVIVQTKCGIVKNKTTGGRYFDLSYDYIIDSVKKSLKRLNLDHIDYLLLHRPDIFMVAEDVARAFSYLLQNGLVRHFGVSNFPHEMLKYLTDHTNIPIEINQLQLGLGHLDLVREVLNSNMNNIEGTEHTGELFFYMKRYNYTLQCWSPFQFEFFGGSIFENKTMANCNKKLEELANKYGVSKCAIATSFLLKLGENIQVVIGTTSSKEAQEAIDGIKVNLSKEDWYSLYVSTGNLLP